MLVCITLNCSHGKETKCNFTHFIWPSFNQTSINCVSTQSHDRTAGKNKSGVKYVGFWNKINQFIVCLYSFFMHLKRKIKWNANEIDILYAAVWWKMEKLRHTSTSNEALRNKLWHCRICDFIRQFKSLAQGAVSFSFSFRSFLSSIFMFCSLNSTHSSE